MNFTKYFFNLVLICVLTIEPLVSVYSEENGNEKCNPLPPEERFMVLGYELGVCKSEVEEIIKQNDTKAELDKLKKESGFRTTCRHLQKC